MGQQEFGRAVRLQLESQGQPLTWLVQQLEAEPAARARMQGDTLPWSTVQNWLDRLTPDPHIAFAIERITGAEPGALSRLLGYVPADASPALTVPEAIAMDPRPVVLSRRGCGRRRPGSASGPSRAPGSCPSWALTVADPVAGVNPERGRGPRKGL